MRAKLLTELVGTAFLVMVVLGSGVMAQNLFQGHVGFALLANSFATAAGLYVLVQCLGAHMNPVVSMVDYLDGRLAKKGLLFYCLAQLLGAYLGILAVHVMFALPLLQLSHLERAGAHLWFSEFVATFGLICVARLSGKNVASCVAAYIAAAYWFTSSTSFANPAVTFARIFTDSFGGMAPAHFVPFVAAQIFGAVLGYWACRRATN